MSHGPRVLSQTSSIWEAGENTAGTGTTGFPGKVIKEDG